MIAKRGGKGSEMILHRETYRNCNTSRRQ